MRNAAEQQSSAFSIWLRTGRRPRAPAAASVELKYNPWHDPRDGRFTSANAGSWTGAGFTHGSEHGFGGGGAGASWPRLETAKKPAGAGAKERPHASIKNPSASAAFAKVRPTTSRLPDRTKLPRVEVRNGYEYRIDDTGRTRQVTGTLMLKDGNRSRTAQAQAGGPDRLRGDDGGHYIARRFNGPTQAFNHFAQDANFNRGGYRALEDSWARAVKLRKRVSVRIAPHYAGMSTRPAEIEIWYSIDHLTKDVIFPNRPKEARRGRQ